MFEPAAGGFEPSFCGPHTALEIGAGKGGDPWLRHMTASRKRTLQPFQPHVFLLKLSMSATVRLYWAARSAQLSLLRTWYAWHEPSELAAGRKSGRLPLEQQTCCFGRKAEQKVAPGLYLVKSAPEMPH